MSETVRVDSIDALKAVEGLGDLMANPKPILQLIAEELYRVARNCFEKQSSPEGQAWQALSPRYAKWKSKRFPGRGILRLRGQLIRSLKRGIEGNDTAFVSEGPLSHAAVHQYGFDGTVTVPAHMRKIKSAFGRKLKGGAKSIQVSAHSRHMRIPARPSMGFPPISQERVAQDIRELITGNFEKGGKK
jgi:phage virion morphogenesis protein